MVSIEVSNKNTEMLQRFKTGHFNKVTTRRAPREWSELRPRRGIAGVSGTPRYRPPCSWVDGLDDNHSLRLHLGSNPGTVPNV